MPTYRVKSPDGRTFRVTAPEGATQEEILARVKTQSGFSAGMTNALLPASMQKNELGGPLNPDTSVGPPAPLIPMTTGAASSQFADAIPDYTKIPELRDPGMFGATGAQNAAVLLRALSGDERDDAAAVRTIKPGAHLFRDPNTGALIGIDEKGQPFVENTPGPSFRDVEDFGGAAAPFALGPEGKGLGLVGRGMLKGAVGGALREGAEVGAREAIGAKQDITQSLADLGLDIGIGGAAEKLLTPLTGFLASRGPEWIGALRGTLDKGNRATMARVMDAFKQANIEPPNKTIMAQIVQAVNRGADPIKALDHFEVLRNKIVGVNRGQVLDDFDTMSEWSALGGLDKTKSQVAAAGADARASVQRRASEIATEAGRKGNTGADFGRALHDDLLPKQLAAKQAEKDAYAAIPPDSFVSPADIRRSMGVTTKVRTPPVLKGENGEAFVASSAPKTFAQLDRMTDAINRKKPLSFTEWDGIRRQLSRAAKDKNPEERAAAVVALQKFDQLEGGAGIVSKSNGDVTQLVRDARSASAKYNADFRGMNDAGEKDVVHRLTQRTKGKLSEAPTKIEPARVAVDLFGAPGGKSPIRFRASYGRDSALLRSRLGPEGRAAVRAELVDRIAGRIGSAADGKTINDKVLVEQTRFLNDNKDRLKQWLSADDFDKLHGLIRSTRVAARSAPGAPVSAEALKRGVATAILMAGDPKGGVVNLGFALTGAPLVAKQILDRQATRKIGKAMKLSLPTRAGVTLTPETLTLLRALGINTERDETIEDLPR